MSRVDKYVWFRAIYAESRFPAGEKAVLGHIAIINVFADRDIFQVRQSTISEQCKISRQTVSSAIGRAKRLGYLKVSDRRATGPGRSGADELRITLPPGVSEDALHQSETPPPGVSEDALHQSEATASDVKQTPESCKANGPNDVKQTPESCKAPNSSTCENSTPNSSLEIVLEDSSSETELIAADDAVPDDPEKAPRKQTSSRGTRLDPDWIPSRPVIAAMRLECPGVDLEAEHRIFVDHWISTAGQRGVKVDWDATWRNWMRREAKRSRPRTTRATSDERFDAIQALKAAPARRELG